MRNKELYWLVLVVIAVLYSIIFFLTPLLYDDLCFVGCYHENGGGDDCFHLKAWLGYITELRNNDNSRISNMLSPFTTVIWPWNRIFPFLSGIVTACIVAAIVRIAASRNMRAPMACVIWFMLVLFLPWRNNILCADYQLNYTYSAIVSLLFVIGVIRLDSRKWPWWIVMLLCVLAIFAGGWHEGFSFPVIGGLGVWALTRRMKMSSQWYVVVAIYVLSAFAFALSPGMIHRAVRERLYPMEVDHFKMFADLSLVILAVVAVGFAGLCSPCRRKCAEVFRQPVFIIFLTAMLLGTLLSVFFDHTARTAFWPEMCAVIVLLLLAKPYLTVLYEKKKILIYGLGLVCFLLCLIHSGVVIYWQKRFSDENNIIMAEMDRNPGTIFHDIILPEEVPAYTLYFPTRAHWVTAFHYWCLESAYGYRNLAVVPLSLRDAAADNSVRLEGNAGASRKGNGIWMNRDRSMKDQDLVNLNVETIDGTIHRHVAGFTCDFVTCNNDTLRYLKIYKMSPENITKVDYEE